MFKLTLALSLLSALVSVRGHGYVQEVVSGSTKYTGYLPYEDPSTIPPPQRIIRKIPGNGPVYDLASIDVQCNGWTEGGAPGSAPAPIFATVAAGSSLALNWTAGMETHFGPMITYMARAPSDITRWNPGTDAVWFKVHELGKVSDYQWAVSDLLETGGVYTFTIPANLKAGQYLIRHEIIALFFASVYPGAQVFPSCIQVEVTGSGTSLPTSFVSFPGAYTATTPGIVFDLFLNTGPYPIPGPPVWP